MKTLINNLLKIYLLNYMNGPNDRWIILLSKNTGNLSIKEEENKFKKTKNKSN